MKKQKNSFNTNSITFDKFAEDYDSWFLKNKNLLESELKLLAHFLDNSGNTISIGCGSGLFEMLLKKEFNIIIKDGIEPSETMAEIARKRGLNVQIGTTENTYLGEEKFDTIFFNGTPSYIKNLEKAFTNAYNALKKGGKIIVLDVPKESSYALIYNLAMTLGTWDHELLSNIQPICPYPIEFVKEANWRTTSEKIEILKKTGFKNFKFAQTLTKHPLYSNNNVEEPKQGYESGDYVAICAIK